MRTAERPCIATVCLSGTLEDKLVAAAAAGFHGVEIFENDLIVSPWSLDRIRHRCAELGMSIDLYQPFRDFEAVPPDVLEANLRRAERKFDLLEQVGTDTLLVCSSVSPDAVDDDDLAAEQLHTLADRAARRGLRIAYEALAWGRFVNTYQHAWRIVRRANHPALGLCLDSFHILSRGSDLAAIRTIPGAKVFFLQLADAPRQFHRNLAGEAPVMDVLEWSRHHRLFPGQGSFDLTSFTGHVLATGYDGPLSLEVFNDVFRQADPRYAAIDAMRSLLGLQETLRTTGPPAVRDRITLGVPPAPRLGGIVFTELSVDDVSGPAVAGTLTALGFTHVGRHRSKPVQLWQQGDARILLNFTPQPNAAARGAAAITALAVDSADPDASAQRAGRLLAPVLPRARQPNEADLSSVAAPDGTAIFFCRTDDWRGDFAPTGAAPRDHALLSGTDHISLTEPFDDFDRTALFYLTVLGLHPEPPTELTAPFGLIRSRAATDPHHHVRITMNAATVRRGDWAPAVPNPQHIAFTTTDAIAAAKTMRALGAPILDIPANYYDDLDARLALPPQLLANLRDNCVLYDRDEHGEYLHFYTDIFGSRVFFEVVQRIGHYAAYGSPTSAPVRMAAHRQQRLTKLTAQHPAAPRHDYSLAHLTALSLSPPELIDTAADAGYRYVGLRLTRVTPDEPHYPLATDPALLRETKKRLAATGVRVLDVELARIGPTDDPRDFLPLLETGAELGARHVITQLPDPDPHRKTDHFAQLCDLAQPLGLTIDLEFPSWTATPTLTEATRVLRAANRPNAGILIDLLHFARSNSSIAELQDLPPEWFHFAHVCDAPAEIPTTTEELIHTARAERLLPGEGGIDTHAILAALPPHILYALEIPHTTRTTQLGTQQYARLAITTARQHLDPPRPTALQPVSTTAARS